MVLSLGLSSESSKMTTEDKVEAKETHASALHDSVRAEISRRMPSIALSIGGCTVHEKGRNWGRLLSGLIAVNVIILGSALVSGSVFNKVAITPTHLQIFLTVLIILTTIWMLYYSAYTSREDHAVLYKDGHAGPIWLRGGLVLFGLCSLIMDVFKIANYVGYLHCESAVKIIFPSVQAVFMLVQTYFLWIHAKDCVQLQRNITRCGLMLTLSTNLMLWMTAVTEESLHQTVVPNTNHSVAPRTMAIKAGGGNSECECSHTACGIFEQAYYYLYPFNIEYSLFASAMAYVMWKNVGRLVDQHNHYPHLRFRLQDVLVGPALGLIVIVVGLATFVVYEVDVTAHDEGKRIRALTMHYITTLVVIILMSIATIAGCIIYRLDQRDHVSGKNPTRRLDVGLLCGASIGQFLICYFTVVAVVASGVMGHLSALNLVCSLFTIIQLGVQNVFIIEGLHREPFHETNDDSVFSNAVAVNSHESASHKPSDIIGETKSNIYVITDTTHNHGHTQAQPHQLTWKRRLLKEICAFLLLSNVTLWIIPAFGARPQFDDPIGVEIYNYNTWVAVVNIGLPFGIFYRMHSVASLFEVYLTS
ncbi:proton channel OTOP2 [Chanos chanos]|uniref:Proton channel OTOP2 n=1 Tax=Chanos chanos TaxID=29144 RepID=A0A6J2WMQ9_CHACN|nr:proton channel OTOP2-like [Chanos chanos]